MNSPSPAPEPLARSAGPQSPEISSELAAAPRRPGQPDSETVDEKHPKPPSNVSAFNRFGTPALSIPCGFSRDGLPVGLQIVGCAFDEANVLAVAFRYQQPTSFEKVLTPN